MAKDYSVELGGQPRFFKYTIAERRYLEGRFKVGLMSLIRDQVYPTNEGGMPTGGGVLDAQIAFLYAGIKHGLGKKNQNEAEFEKWVVDWIAEADDRNVILLLIPAIAACFQSGCLGMRVGVPEEEEDPGKAEPAS